MTKKQIINSEYHILIIDDDAEMRGIVAGILTKEGYNVFEASNGEEGIESLIRLSVPNLILLDTHMPKMNGLTFLKEIRNLWNSSVLPVVAVTGDDSTQTIIDYFKSGVNDYIRKPFNSKELVLRVASQIQLASQNVAMKRFVPGEFLKMMGKENLTDLSLGDQVQTEVSVLFNDIRNFTHMSEHMEPRENFRFVNAYLKRIVPVIRSYNGFIDKYIGDCIMALFPEAPDDAISAAIEISREIEEYNLERAKDGFEPIMTGSGVNTGKLILGVIGDAQRMESTVISDAVNVAARLEGLTKNYGVKAIISENSLARTTRYEINDFRFLEEIAVRGKSRPLMVYEVLGCREKDEIRMINSYRDIYEKACRDFRKGDYKKAIEYFSQILAINPKDCVVQYLLEKARLF